MIVTDFSIEVENYAILGNVWKHFCTTSKHEWENTLKGLRLTYPGLNLRAIKQITITEVIREVIG